MIKIKGKSLEMKKKCSKKHHYLPRYYLKGFTDNKNCFFVYDKQSDKILPPTSPDAVFFENNLNTITFPQGDSSDCLEEMYTIIESKSWGSLDNIRKSTINTPIKPLDKMNLFLFLLLLHWRLPSNIDHVEKLSEETFLDNNGHLDYFKLVNNDGTKAPKEVIELIKNASAFKKSLKIELPFAPFKKDKNWLAKLVNWRFVFYEDSWLIVGDNPIVTKGESDHDPVNCLNEFIFPVSGKILLVNVNRPLRGMLPPEFIIQYNIAIIERARRFVACYSKEFLEAMIKQYKIYIQFEKTNIIIPELFKSLKQ